jgi:DNA-directed RNA polymerase subunit RPC12/RpoP
MAAKCTSCGKTISTWQELSTVGAGAIKGVWHFVKDNGAAILAIIARIAATSGVVGAVAGPMNVNDVPCPYCGAEGRWVDSE